MKKMKKTICALFSFAMLCTTSIAMMTGCSSSTSTPHKFDKSDATVNGVSMGMTLDEVKEKLGEPEVEYSNAVEYNGLMLYFTDEDDRILKNVEIKSEKIKLSNGLSVGSSKEKVISSYTDDGEEKPLYLPVNGDEACGIYLYGGFNKFEIQDQKEADSYQFAYIDESMPSYDYIEYHYCEVTNRKSYYTESNLYTLTFCIDKNTDKVQYIQIECDYQYLFSSTFD